MEPLASTPVISNKKAWRTPAWTTWGPVLILLLAAGLRLWALDIKPAHFDEGINGWFADRMTGEGFYRYDPENYHGPLHFYAVFFSQTLFGRNLWALRLPVVLVGLATVWMTWLYRRHIGDRAAALAALAMAIGPGFVFYQRYSIHESWLVLFLMLAVWGLLGLCQSGHRTALWSLVAGVTGMILTKETYLIHGVAMVLAFPTLKLLDLWIPAEPPLTIETQTWTPRHLHQALVVSGFLLVFFYSGNLFQLNTSSFEALITTFEAWVKTGTEQSGHQKMEYQLGPLNYFWVAMCWRYEPFAILGMVMCFVVLGRCDWRVRWLAIFGVGCLVAYSIIPYKTPWCNIAIIWPFYLLAGVLLDQLLATRLAVLAPALYLACAQYSLRQDWRLNLTHYDDDSEPYVYVQTYRDIGMVTGPVFARVGREPGRRNMTITVNLESYYPLPWIFGDFPNVGYVRENGDQPIRDADLIICTAVRGPEVEGVLHETYHRVPFRLRSGMGLCMAYFNHRMFAREFPHTPPDFQGNKPDDLENAD